MKKIIILCFSFSFLLCQNIPFQIGEKLLFNASFSGLNAANASLEIIEKSKINNKNVYHIKFIAQSKGAINYLFPISDEIDLWLDEETLLPVRIHENINEGNYKRFRIVNFNHQNNYAIVNNDSIKIDHTTQSPYSLFYFFRIQNIMNYFHKDITLIQNGKIINLKLDINKNEKIVVPSGTYTCLTISPKRTDNKQFKNKAEMEIFFSNDENQYPVKIRLSLKVGSLILKLREIIN